MVSDTTIKKFQEAMKAERGIVLSDKEAKEVLLNWVGFFDLLTKIYHRTQSDKSNPAS